MNQTKWSDTAWNAVEPIYTKILQLPFLKQLADGSLSAEKFRFYISQDALYLDGYAACLAHIASRLRHKDQIESFLKFALDGIEVERALHASFLSDIELSKLEKSPSCLLYTSLLKAQATSPVEVEAAATLPCFWIYQRVGEDLLANAIIEGNQYGNWISTYGDPSFAIATNRAIEICDALADEASDEIKQAMTDIFVKCAKMEWLFWESAYNMEQWKI